ncbi:MAG: TfoX/Sxy family protein [Chloroflexi bacterium]|nr:TfoX/Sxy family protein [Chloroflexota bacterium]MDA1228600.1 TfoX/Sxy family protein [Chloroflexota bacterium]
MAYDEGLAQRIREVFQGNTGVDEKKMFGGIAFMVEGNMCVGVVGDELMVRVGPDQYEDSLAQPNAREMDFTGRAMKGMVYIDTDGVDSDVGLQSWVDRGLAFVTTLPPK